MRLSNRRGSNGFGPAPIAYGEIEAFQNVTGFRFSPWEVDMIEHLDAIYFDERAKARGDE